MAIIADFREFILTFEDYSDSFEDVIQLEFVNLSNNQHESKIF